MTSWAKLGTGISPARKIYRNLKGFDTLVFQIYQISGGFLTEVRS